MQQPSEIAVRETPILIALKWLALSTTIQYNFNVSKVIEEMLHTYGTSTSGHLLAPTAYPAQSSVPTFEE